MAITIENLGKLQYFKGLETEQLKTLPQLFMEKWLIKGQAMVTEGDHDENLYFVGSGVVKIFKTSAEGKEQIIKLVRPGESFNEIAVYGSVVSPYTGQSLGSTLIFGINKKELMPLLKSNWKMALNAITALVEQSRLLLTLVEDLSFKNVTGRVAKILLQHSSPGPDGFPRLTQYEMAAMAGTAREVVGRSLKSLEESGAIKLERHRILIANKRYLEQMAGFN